MSSSGNDNPPEMRQQLSDRQPYSHPRRIQTLLRADRRHRRQRSNALGRRRLGERLIAMPAVDDVGNHLAALHYLVQVSPREGNSLT